MYETPNIIKKKRMILQDQDLRMDSTFLNIIKGAGV